MIKFDNIECDNMNEMIKNKLGVLKRIFFTILSKCHGVIIKDHFIRKIRIKTICISDIFMFIGKFFICQCEYNYCFNSDFSTELSLLSFWDLLIIL